MFKSDIDYLTVSNETHVKC